MRKPIHLEQGAVSILEIRRPEKANAYTREMLNDILTGLESLNEATRALILISEGEGAFCAGADLTELGEAAPEDALSLHSQRVFTTLANLPCVTIAAVHGPAVAGGMELALACDLRVVGPRARFSLPEPSLGLIPAAGGCSRLSRLIGPGRSRAMILGGMEIDARTAIDWGLAELYADQNPRDRARTWATDIATRDPIALRLAKRALSVEGKHAALTVERLSEALLYARRNPS